MFSVTFLLTSPNTYVEIWPKFPKSCSLKKIVSSFFRMHGILIIIWMNHSLFDKLDRRIMNRSFHIYRTDSFGPVFALRSWRKDVLFSVLRRTQSLSRNRQLHQNGIELSRDKFIHVFTSSDELIPSFQTLWRSFLIL